MNRKALCRLARLSGSEDQFELALAFDLETLGPILICMCMSTHHDRGRPAGYRPLDDLTDDRFPKYGAIKNVPDRPIRRTETKEATQ
jgi:hypothetical protein